MTLQFDSGVYGNAYQHGQQNQQADRDRLLQLIQSIGPAIGQIGQGYQQRKQLEQENQPLWKLLGGKSPMSSSNQLSAPVSPIDRVDSMQPNQMQNFQPMTQNVLDIAPQPEIPPGPMAQPMNHIEAFQNFLKGSQGQTATPQPIPQSSEPSLPYGIPSELSNLNMKQLEQLSKAKSLFQKPEQETKQFAGLDEQGNPLLFGTKSGKFTTGQVPGGKIMPKPAASSMTNTDYSSASPQDQQMAQGVQEGRIRPSDISFRDRGRIVGMAQDYATKNNLPFQSYAGDVKRGMAENLAYGKIGQNALSLNTALGHIGDAAKAYQSVQNTNQQWLNKPINEIRRQTNDPGIVALDINLNAVAGELATVFKGSGGTDQEIGHWANVLTSNLTPQQAQSALQKAGELLNSRLNAMKYQQGNVMNQPVGNRELLSPHGADVMQQIGSPVNNQSQTVQRKGPDGHIYTYTLNPMTGKYE